MKQFFNKITNWELWPYDLFYFPIGIYWLYFGIKARAFWFFSTVNPSIEFAGFEGGSKMEVYQQLPSWIYPTTILIAPNTSITSVKEQCQATGLTFPFIAKPDLGMQGRLFRVIKNETDLERYHNHVTEPFLLQTFVKESTEFSVYYIRYPNAEKGIITGLVTKDYLYVVGNGVDSLGTLIEHHPNPAFDREIIGKAHEATWNYIVPKDEKYSLSDSGNHRLGAKFINLNHEIDTQLCETFDKISHQSNQLYYGRYDLKCTSLADLKAGKNISVLEFNGAGASITHVHDRGMSYIAALKEVVMHWRHLYAIGKINNQAGTPYWTRSQGTQYLKKAKANFKKLTALDKGIA